MAYDKVIDSSALDANLASIAEAIRTKGGTTDQLVFPAGFISAIEAIEAGSGDIVVGSFTLTESLTISSPLYIDITFPKNEFPFMYCVFEDMQNLKYDDTSHIVARIINVMCIKVYNTFYNEYLATSVYMKSGSYSRNYVDQIISYTSNGYAIAGGVCGSMAISLSDNQIRFKPPTNGNDYLAGRTYYYILLWE